MKRPSWLRALFWTLVLGYTALHLGYSVMRYNVFSGTSSGDFNRAWQEAGDWKAQIAAGEKPEGTLHPPLYYLILLKVGALCGGRTRTALFFYFLQFLLFPAAVWLMVRAAWVAPGPAPLRAYGLAAALTLNFQPLLETLSQHKVEGVEFFLICLAVWALRRSRQSMCGGLVALAANLKYLPAILLAHFTIQRSWRVLWGAAAGAILVLGLLWLGTGDAILRSVPLRSAAEMLLSHKHEGTHPATSAEFQTLTGTVNRWLARPRPGATFMDYLRAGSYMPVPQVDLSRRIALGLKLLLIGVWVVFLSRSRRAKERREGSWDLRLLELSFSLGMIFIISQFARVNYLILLLPSFVWTGLLMMRRPGSFTRPEQTLFGLAYALTAMLIPGGLLNKLPPHPVWGQMHSLMYLWWSLPFYGILLLGGCILVMHHRIGKGVPLGK